MHHGEPGIGFAPRLWADDELGVMLDTSALAVDEEALRARDPLMARALEEMEALEGGAVANPDEGRRVGHYWLRTPDLAPDAATRDAILAACAAVLEFARRVREGSLAPTRAPRFRAVLQVGIGGSSLGPRLLAEALGPPSPDPLRLLYLDNTDPDGIDRTLDALGDDLEATLVVVASKSGTTPETRNGMIEVAARLSRAGLLLSRSAVAITLEGSALDRQAEAEGWLARFPLWDWVGGRTSLFSPVGLLPAALLGIDVEALLAGARAMDRLTRARETANNPAAQLAVAWHVAGDGRGQKDMVVLPYKDRLELFPRYLQQLVMESLGKRLDREGRVVHQGLTVYGNKGSTDQHAYVQQLRDGLDNFFVTFVRVLRDRAPEREHVEVEPGIGSGDYLHGFLLGTRRALSEAGRGSILLTLDDLTPRTLGALVALYERAVGLYASMIGVNAYDQPGVEAGKRAAAAILDLERRLLAALRARPGERFTVVEAARLVGCEDVETVFQLLCVLAANPRHGVAREEGAEPRLARYGAR